MKICTRCRESKNIDQFHRDATKKDGRTLQCSDCIAVRSADYYQRNKERIKINQRKYYADNREHYSIIKREYYLRKMAGDEK